MVRFCGTPGQPDRIPMSPAQCQCGPLSHRRRRIPPTGWSFARFPDCRTTDYRASSGRTTCKVVDQVRLIQTGVSPSRNMWCAARSEKAGLALPEEGNGNRPVGPKGCNRYNRKTLRSLTKFGLHRNRKMLSTVGLPVFAVSRRTPCSGEARLFAENPGFYFVTVYHYLAIGVFPQWFRWLPLRRENRDISETTRHGAFLRGFSAAEDRPSKRVIRRSPPPMQNDNCIVQAADIKALRASSGPNQAGQIKN